MRPLVVVVTLAALLAGCKVGPNYARPNIPAPPQYRGAKTAPAQPSLGEVKWFDVFQDDQLRALINEALKANYDIRIAAQRVLQAQGQLTATRSSLFPFLGLRGSASRDGINSPISTTAGGYGVAFWELDLFGKLRRATEAARADVLALEENQKAVMQILVSQVATAYFDLCEYDAEIQFVTASIATRQESLKLVISREQGGVGSLMDVDQARTLVASAQANLALLEKAQEQTENLISFLVGRQPGPIARGRALTEQPQPPEVPAGLPSALLDRRPDIRAAEQNLVAANARVGVAKAAFFPSIALTGVGGYQSSDLLGVVKRHGFAYSVGGVVDLPIFDAGRRRGDYNTAKAQNEELLIAYQRSINGAFQEVSDSLVGYQKSKEYTVSQALLAETLRHQSQIATQRYIGGVSSYLEVLDTERQRLSAEQGLAQAQRDVLTTLVQLYKALGGGWQ
jgi:multidrug efflux system outer membrane protein